MALEELFKNVTKRFNDDAPEEHEPVFKCPRCQQTTPESKFQELNKVCPHCNYHARLTAAERMRLTVDSGSFVEYDAEMHSADPLQFPGYARKVESLQTMTGLKDAVITGECTIKGSRTVLIIMDSHFMMASMGSVVGEKITRAFETATEKGLPVVAFTASGGARMQEGIISLMQMAKTSAAVAKHNDAGLLYLTVMTDPTTGGVTVCFAGRYYSGRAEGAHRVRRQTCHRGDDSPAAARQFPAGRIFAGKGLCGYDRGTPQHA